MEEQEKVETVLRRELGLLVGRLRPWEPGRWSGRAAPWGGVGVDLGTRGDVAHHLARVLAAPVLELHGRTTTEVPRLPHDTALPDQLAVLAGDLLDEVQEPETLRAVLAEVLLHRADLDGSGPGAGATACASPGVSPAAAVASWRGACSLG